MSTLPINKYPHSALQLFLDSKGNWAIPVCSSSKYKVLFSVFIYLLIPCESKGSFDYFCIFGNNVTSITWHYFCSVPSKSTLTDANQLPWLLSYVLHTTF